MGLVRELELLGAHDIITSSNAELTRSGEIAARQRRIDDTGVAAYFTLNGEQRCIPCVTSGSGWRTTCTRSS